MTTGFGPFSFNQAIIRLNLVAKEEYTKHIMLHTELKLFFKTEF